MVFVIKVLCIHFWAALVLCFRVTESVGSMALWVSLTKDFSSCVWGLPVSTKYIPGSICA